MSQDANLLSKTCVSAPSDGSRNCYSTSWMPKARHFLSLINGILKPTLCRLMPNYFHKAMHLPHVPVLVSAIALYECPKIGTFCRISMVSWSQTLWIDDNLLHKAVSLPNVIVLVSAKAIYECPKQGSFCSLSMVSWSETCFNWCQNFVTNLCIRFT